jgi:hypothetical protein
MARGGGGCSPGVCREDLFARPQKRGRVMRFDGGRGMAKTSKSCMQWHCMLQRELLVLVMGGGNQGAGQAPLGL